MRLAALIFLLAMLSADASAAKSMMDPVVHTLKTHGYRNVKVQHTGGVYKVEGTIKGQVREIVYDARNGHILSDRIDTDGDGRMDRVVHDYAKDRNDRASYEKQNHEQESGGNTGGESGGDGEGSD
jgi:polyisoprenoid-binding protein YceI